jgi:hypothetical protein
VHDLRTASESGERGAWGLTSAVTPVRYKDKRHWLKTRSKLLYAGVSIAVMLTVLPFPPATWRLAKQPSLQGF